MFEKWLVEDNASCGDAFQLSDTLPSFSKTNSFEDRVSLTSHLSYQIHLIWIEKLQ